MQSWVQPECRTTQPLGIDTCALRRPALSWRSLNYLDGRLPEGSLLSGWVQYGYLAVVIAWRKLLESNAETEGHGLQAIVQPLRHFHRRGFKGFCLLVV